MTTLAPALSLCVRCDAPPGACSHDGPRYLEPIVYERAGGGWKVPESERADWERRERRLLDGPSGQDQGRARSSETEPPKKPGARPLQQLVVELEGWLDLDRDLEASFRALYERRPDKATKLVERMVSETRAGKLDSPEGFLAWRLKELRS